MAGPLLAGKYELLREIATGGMAEVFLARQTGLSGFEKLVCIKRILPHRAADEEFMRMFLDEARTAADLRHPNIVDLYEIGEDAGDGHHLSKTLYIAMEYVHGHTLRYVAETAKLAERPIPRALATQMIIEAARGLHYAHTKKDLRGVPLGIVHRDVSPQNLLVTFEGVTKVCDFGIAKAAGRMSTTNAGMVKGKASYMSPEQAMGHPLDARSDLFSLGIIFYELTTGARLFGQTSVPEAMDAIVACNITSPRVLIGPDYPAALAAIVMKLLARNKEDRFPSGAALAAACEDFLAAERVRFSAEKLASYLRGIFPADERELERIEAPAPGGSSPAPSAYPPTIVDGPSSSSEGPTTPIPMPLASRTNLPADSGHFVGRKADLAALAVLFDTGARLVSVLGPGGAGKTRLAVRFGRQLFLDLAKDGGGVWMADLSSARTAEDVVRAMGDALGVPLTRGGTAENIAHLSLTLAGRGPTLMILDNFEQVVEHGPATVGRWLGAAPDAMFLVTSRERLKLEGEQTHDLAPLGLPEGDQAIGDSEAVQLFVERARAVRADFVLTPADAVCVAQIVRTLDGLPLAIELAASRMKVFSPARLLERLPQRFELLTGARRDTTGRQATLKGTIDWSWTLLSPFEQAALAQASVFRSGFTLEAAEAVLDLSKWPGAAWVPDVVQSLRDKSLLRSYSSPDAPGELRFAMYESIREYAAGKLAEEGGDGAALTRHGEYFVRMAGSWADAVDLHGGLERLRKLTRDYENLLAVHRRAGRSRGAKAALMGAQAVLALQPLFVTRGPFGTYVRLADEALAYARLAGVEETVCARLLHGRGWMRRSLGEVDACRRDLEAALKIALTAGDRALEGRVLRDVGLVSWDEGRFENSRMEYARALGIHRKAGDRDFEGRTLVDLAGFDQEQGLLDDAQEKYEMAIAILREVGDRRYEGVALGYLGALLQERERYDASRVMYVRALQIHREFGDRRSETMFTTYQGTFFQERGELGKARKAYQHALELARSLGDRRQEGFILSWLGAVDCALGRLDDATASLIAARERLVGTGSDRLLMAMLGLLNGLEVIGRAGKGPEAEHARLALEERLAECETPGGAGWTGPDAQRSLAEASMDVRLASRVLRRALVACQSAAT